MKYHVHVSSFGALPYWIVSPTGVVVATHKSQKSADRCVAFMNKNPDWYRNMTYANN